MFAVADVILRAVTMQRFVDRGHLRRGAERLFAVELKHRAGVHDAQEFSARIGPQILFGTVHRDRTRRDQRDQHVLIDGQVVLEGGKLTTVDEAAALDALDEVGRNLLARAGWTPPITWPVVR